MLAVTPYRTVNVTEFYVVKVNRIDYSISHNLKLNNTILMSIFRVFLGAPTAVDFRDAQKQDGERTYKWQTVSSKQLIARSVTSGTQSHDEIQNITNGPGRLQAQGSLIYDKQRYASISNVGASQSVVFPLATLEAASRRISLIYKNIIVDESANEEEEDGVGKYEVGHTGVARGMATFKPSLHSPLLTEEVTVQTKRHSIRGHQLRQRIRIEHVLLPPMIAIMSLPPHFCSIHLDPKMRIS